MTARLTFVARITGWVAGRRVRRGERVQLTAAEARFEPVDPVPTELAPELAPKPKRRRAPRRKVAP